MASAWDKPADDGTEFNNKSFLMVGMDNNVYLKNSDLDNYTDTIKLTKTGNYIWISQDFNGDFLVISKDNKLYYSPGLFINNIDNYKLNVTTITNSLTSFTPLLNINGYVGCTTDGKILLFDDKKNYKITLTLTGYTGSKIVKAYAYNLFYKDNNSNVYFNDEDHNTYFLTVRDIKTTIVPVTKSGITSIRMYVSLSGFKYIGGEYQNLWMSTRQLGNVKVICISAIKSWYAINKMINKNLKLKFCVTDGSNPDSDPGLFNSLKNSTIPIQPSLYHMLRAYPDASLFPYKFISLYDLLGLGKAKYIYSQIGTGNVSIAFDMYIMKFNLKLDKYFPLGDLILKHPFSGPNPDLTNIWIPLVYYDNKQIYSTILPDSTWINVKNNLNNYNDEYQWGTCALAESNRLYNTQYISTGDCFTDTNTSAPGNQCAGFASRPIAAVRVQYVIPTTIQPTDYTSTNYQIANLKVNLYWESGAWGSRKGHSYNNYDIFTLTTPFNTFNITAQDFIWKNDYPKRVLPNKNKPGEIPDISTVEGTPPGYTEYPFGGKSYYWPTYLFGDLVPEFLLAIMCGDSSALSKLNTVLPIQLSDAAKNTCSDIMSIFMQKDNYSNLSNLKSNQPIIDWCNNKEPWGGGGTCDLILTAFCTLGSDGKPVSKAETIIKNGPTEWTTPKEILNIFPNSKNTDICGSFMPAPNYYAAMDYGEAKGNKALEAGVSQVLTGKGYNETSCTAIGSASEIYTSNNYPNMVQCPSIQVCMNSVDFENMGTINGEVSLNLKNDCSQSTTPPPSSPPSSPPPGKTPEEKPKSSSNVVLFVIIAVVVVAIVAIIMFMKFR
jgi:hypothetical protein